MVYYILFHIFILKIILNLLDKNIGLQNIGLTEKEAWISMLSKTQSYLAKSYRDRNYDKITEHQKEIDFIQKQIVRINSKKD